MGSWLRRVPGFRSGVRWKTVIAILGYGLIALLLLVGLAGGIGSALVLALMGLAVVLLATNIGGLRSRVPVLNSPNKVKAAAGWVGLLFAGLVAFVVSAPPPRTAPVGASPTPAAVAQATATEVPSTPTSALPTATQRPATSTPVPEPTVPPTVATPQPEPPPPPTGLPAVKPVAPAPAQSAPTPTAIPTPVLTPRPTFTSVPTVARLPTATPAPAVAQKPVPAKPVHPATGAVSAGLAVRPQGRVCPPSHQIKGNASGWQPDRPTDPIYHVPGSQYYASTNPEVCFASVENATRANFRAPR